VLDEVSTAILGGAAAENKELSGRNRPDNIRASSVNHKSKIQAKISSLTYQHQNV